MAAVSATELFWLLVEKKAEIHPATKPSKFSKSFVAKEQTWDRFKTIADMTGTLPTDFTLTPQPAETDLDQMDDPNIEPKYHPQVLRDQRLDLSFSGDAPPLKETIERGKKAKFERGGEGKAYGKRYIRNQFKSLDFSADTLKVINLPLSLSAIDEAFATEVPHLEELSVSGHSLSAVDNLPPSLISLNAHCNRLCEWPPLPSCIHLRHLGLSGNQLTSLDGITPEVAERLSLLSSLDISANLLARIALLKPLASLPALSSLRVSGNPLVLLPQYRTQAIAQVAHIISLDGINVLETERPPPPEEPEEADADADAETAEEAAEEAAAEEKTEEAATEEGAEGAEGGEEEEEKKEEDLEGRFTLRFKVRDIEGLKNPNPEPPEPPEPAEGEEPPEPPPEFEFYTENPILYYIEIAVPGQDPVKSEEIEWTAPPGADDGEEAPKMDFELDTTVTLEASPTMLQWLRWKGIVLSLYMKKKEMPPPPKEEGEEDEEVEPEASGESKGEEKSGEDGDEEEEEEPEKFIITKLATATIQSKSLVEAFAPMELKVEVNKWSEKDDRTVAIDDRETEKFLQPHKPKKDRQKDFDKEMKAKKKGPPPNKKLLAILNFGVELNPEPEPTEEEEDQ